MSKKNSTLKNNIGPVVRADGQHTTTSPQEMADILQTQYVKAWSTPSANIHTTEETPVQDKDTLQDKEIRKEDIENAIDNMKTSASSGPNGIGTYILNECKKTISIPLLTLWRKSLDTGEIPEIFKFANVTPIHKGGSKKEPKN
ncbi:uncharacterized protein LOC143041260 [Oratosquilla oratoria]|uniref:uncharacterized protein LOC143041260 n=1 Tax=Oratosquilla oratoria TaxID=337810 RepID=UPI003F76D827